MNIADSLQAKSFYRFTGPPEHWLTAIVHMTWGLEEKHRSRWEQIQPGDVFFIHSTGKGSSDFSNAQSGIIGIGVVDSNFREKEDYLWWYEMKHEINKWPLLIPFSELYLFNDLSDRLGWPRIQPGNEAAMKKMIDRMLQKKIPISDIDGFPVMGSFSSTSDSSAMQILKHRRPLFLHSGSIGIESDKIISPRMTRFEEIEKASQSLRYSKTLQIFDEVQPRIVNQTSSVYTRNNELLARAEKAHSTVLQSLINMFREKGYDTLYNEHVDLFAHNKKQGYLIDVKSLENKNFRKQARKGIAQLFEYDYFEVSKFTQEEQLNLKERYKSLVFSREPKDKNYIEFMNHLKIGAALPDGSAKLKPVGADLGFSRI